MRTFISGTVRSVTVLALVLPGLFLPGATPAQAQPVNAGVAYLAGSQAADGSWQSPQVRQALATTEALRALQVLGTAPVHRQSAVSFLQTAPVEDSDDRARRIAVLAAHGQSVTSLLSQLRSDADSGGGWGLTSSFVADPLDTSLALAAVAPQPTVGNDVLLPALSALAGAQRSDGGWACIDSSADDSEIFCSGQALLTLAAYRSRFSLTSQVNGAVGFLRGQLQPNGSFGPAGSVQVINTAVASLGLVAVSGFGGEVPAVISFLEGQQRPDGSWEGDPYTTALALQALRALDTVPFCGNGLIDQPGEACDSGVPSGVTCQSLGFGAGTLACSSQCTLVTSGCAAAPICGDNLRNQPFEVCDGTDLASQTCKTQGFAAGNLACAGDCRTFNVSGCSADPTCGDGVVNQPSELCDLSDLRGQSCLSLGLGGGILRCAADCNLDTSQCNASNQVISNKGREFFTGFLDNPLGAVTASVQLTSDVPTSVTVQYPVNTPSFSQTVSLTPGQVTIVDLPSSVTSNWPAGQVRNNAVRLSGPNDFVAYVVNRAPFTSDAGMGLPVEALGTSYILTTYQGSFINGADRPEFLVIAPFDGTTVTITPTASLQIPPPGLTAPPGVPFQIQLNRGQGFRGEARFFGVDFTGTLIESNRPVAVLNGNTCANISVFTVACDHIFDIAHPVTSWGISAVVANLPGRPGGSIYRVVASVDGTQVSLDGVLQATLNRGKFLEVGPLAGNHSFTADHPIFVSQFMTGVGSPGAILGDPAMVNMIPPDQFLKSYTFSTVGGAQFANHFLTVITPTSAIGALTLDGTPIAANQFSPVPGSIFSAAVVPITQGAHTTVSPQSHGITVEGINQADSYIYPGGAQLAFINLFCGDGRANRDAEQCDGNDFRGNNCASFGFSAGFLQCTVDCRIDTSQCSGFTSVDQDGDGFPANKDCNDQDPLVNPGMPEIPGNGIDDDCNPLTPDAIPQGGVSCRLFTDRLSYDATQVVSFQAEVDNTHPSQTMVGLSAALQVTGGASIPVGTRQIAPLPPGARAQQNFILSAAGNPPGNYVANLTVTAGAQSVALCSASFTITNSTTTGAGLTGTLTLNPDKVNAGDPSNATYTVRNGGNAALAGLAVRVLLLDPQSGAIVGELDDTADLSVGATFSNTRPFSTVGLAINKTYLAVLLAKAAGAAVEQTLASASLTVVNSPPICAHAVSPGNLWPPNHKLKAVQITGVTDPENDPVTLTITGVLQDEPTNALGSGDTCPDATGVGTPQASVRAERAGPQDGRVYHVFFKASDGRGGVCEGQVQVCVPHDNGHGGACVDQGALFDSTVCH
jgi:hypothetical protein